MFNKRYSDADFRRLLSRCSDIPPVTESYLVDDYVENMLLTVLDFQLRGITVERAMTHYQKHAQRKVNNFAALKNLLATYSDTLEGNRQLAQYLWGYNYWSRVELLRRFVNYFEEQGVTTQEQLKQWAERADFERDFKGRVKGAGYAIFQWLVMRQGIETIKPDVWIHRFIRDTLGYSVSDETAVAMLKEVALELDIKAYELDWRIWRYQHNR